MPEQNITIRFKPLGDKKLIKAINDLNLKIETESELMAYCDFFKNVADTK